jgi:hypothetical protein
MSHLRLVEKTPDEADRSRVRVGAYLHRQREEKARVADDHM